MDNGEGDSLRMKNLLQHIMNFGQLMIAMCNKVLVRNRIVNLSNFLKK